MNKVFSQIFSPYFRMNQKTPTIVIQGKEIGSSNETYFVAEAGLNHNGDIKLAKKLIDEAHDCRANAIKFQTYKSENFLTMSSPYYDFFKNVELGIEEFGELKDYSKSVGITFFSSPFDIESADNLKKIGVPCFKIASSDLTNFPLVKHVAKMNIPMIISTGLANLNEVKETMEICESVGNNNIILVHSVANYPTLPEEANLLAIKTLKKHFAVPVGYSDNGESELVDLVAVSMGADLIEKHFTLDKKLPGPDHNFSIDPKGLKKLISEIRLIEKIRGKEEKTPQPSEIKNIQAIRKSITASVDIHKGDELNSENLAIKRPALGIEPKHYEKILGKKVKNDILKDSTVKWDDLIE